MRLGRATLHSSWLAELLPDPKGQATNVIHGLGPIKGVEENVKIGQSVFIVGSTTGIGKAAVTVLAAVINVTRPSSSRVEGLIGLQTASGPGYNDGGAPVLTEDGKLIGIILASQGSKLFAVPIQPLFDALGVELY
jgi:hypothetical protein